MRLAWRERRTPWLLISARCPIRYTPPTKMAKQAKSKNVGEPAAASIFTSLPTQRKHPRLFLGKYLKEEADKAPFDPVELERVGAILKQWATLAREGHLDRKETDARRRVSSQKIFGEALELQIRQ
jgi:hypothetical protein